MSNGYETLAEDYAPLELAKLLKKAGYDWPCMGYWSKQRWQGGGGDYGLTLNCNVVANHNTVRGHYSAPLLQHVIKWLDCRGIVVEVCAAMFNEADGVDIIYHAQFCSGHDLADGKEDYEHYIGSFTTMYNAINAGLLEAVKHYANGK